MVTNTEFRAEKRSKLPSINWATYAPLIALIVLVALSAAASEHFSGAS